MSSHMNHIHGSMSCDDGIGDGVGDDKVGVVTVSNDSVGVGIGHGSMVE